MSAIQKISNPTLCHLCNKVIVKTLGFTMMIGCESCQKPVHVECLKNALQNLINKDFIMYDDDHDNPVIKDNLLNSNTVNNQDINHVTSFSSSSACIVSSTIGVSSTSPNSSKIESPLPTSSSSSSASNNPNLSNPKIPTTLNNNNITNNTNEAKECDDCIICMEPKKRKDNISVIDCCHSFHHHCISKWLIKKAECPLCRTKILKDNIDAIIGVHDQPLSSSTLYLPINQPSSHNSNNNINSNSNLHTSNINPIIRVPAFPQPGLILPNQLPLSNANISNSPVPYILNVNSRNIPSFNSTPPFTPSYDERACFTSPTINSCINLNNVHNNYPPIQHLTKNQIPKTTNSSSHKTKCINLTQRRGERD